MRAACHGRVLVLAGLTLLAPAPGRAAVDLPPAKEVRLPNGATLLLAEKRDVPLIAFVAYLRGGSLVDPPGSEGLAALTAGMLRKGAGKRSAREIASAADGVGARLDTGASLEVSWVSGEFLARDEGLMLDLLASLLLRPSFPDSEFLKLKQQSIEAIRAGKDNPNNVLDEYGRAFLFLGHPYGRSVEGDENTLEGITREEVIESYRANYGGDRLILSMVGDFDSNRMEQKLRAAFADWAKARAPMPAVPRPAPSKGRRVLLVDKPDATQTYFWIGNVGIARTDADRDAVDLANTAFGGRFTSMLNTALRVQSGLTYGVRSRLTRHTLPGPLAIMSFTKTESTRRAVDMALDVLGKFRAAGLDSITVASVKSYISGLYPTTLETGDAIAALLSDLAFYGLTRAEITEYARRIEALEPAAIGPVVRRVYPGSEDLTLVLIGNAAKVRPIARRYGPLAEARFEEPLLTAVRAAANRAR